MYIHEAVKQARETGRLFHRTGAKLKTCAFGVGLCKRGTITVHSLRYGDAMGFWAPEADDLIANDWELREEYAKDFRLRED